MYDFWKDVSGKDHHDLKARKAHLERAIANGDTPESLAKKVHMSGRRMFRARAQAMGGVAGVGVATAVAAKKYSDYQNRLAADNLKAVMGFNKEAQVDVTKFWSSVRAKVKPMAKKTFKVGKDTFDSGIDVINTAHGGKVKQFGENAFGVDNPSYKKFQNASAASKLRQVYRNAAQKAGPAKADRRKAGSDALRELSSLQRKQRSAMTGVYGTAAITSYAYSKRDKKGRMASTPQYYY